MRTHLRAPQNSVRTFQDIILTKRFERDAKNSSQWDVVKCEIINLNGMNRAGVDATLGGLTIHVGRGLEVGVLYFPPSMSSHSFSALTERGDI